MDTRSDTQLHDQERTRTRDNKSASCFLKDLGEKIELVRTCHGGGCIIHTEEIVEEGYVREREEKNIDTTKYIPIASGDTSGFAPFCNSIQIGPPLVATPATQLLCNSHYHYSAAFVCVVPSTCRKQCSILRKPPGIPSSYIIASSYQWGR